MDVRDPSTEREAGCLALSGLLLLPALVAALVTAGGLSLGDAVFVGLTVELLPVLSIAQVSLAARASFDRIEAYLGTAVVLTVLGAAALALGAEGPGWAAMGLVPFPPPDLLEQVAWTAGLLVFAAALMLGFHLLERATGVVDSPLLRRLLPRTGRETRTFAGVSLLAAYGEEAAFRGFLIPVLAPLLGGMWVAAAFTSAVFGLMHAYQGALGMLRTGLLGFAFAAAFVLGGSLWPAIVAHLIVNLVGGLWLGDRLSPEPRDGG